MVRNGPVFNNFGRCSTFSLQKRSNYIYSTGGGLDCLQVVEQKNYCNRPILDRENKTETATTLWLCQPLYMSGCHALLYQPIAFVLKLFHIVMRSIFIIWYKINTIRFIMKSIFIYLMSQTLVLFSINLSKVDKVCLTQVNHKTSFFLGQRKQVQSF